MDAIKLYDMFRQLFPLFDVQSFEKAGEYSILIHTSVTGISFIFTFRSPLDWRFETVSMYGMQLFEKENENEF